MGRPVHRLLQLSLQEMMVALIKMTSSGDRMDRLFFFSVLEVEPIGFVDR